jgi:hypothetical protein
MVTGLGALAMVSERLIHHLGNSQMIEVSLAPDRLDPAALDMEGDALGLLGGIAGVTGEVYPAPDLAAVPTSTAPIASLSADIRCTLGLLSLFRPGNPLGHDVRLDALLGQAHLEVQQPCQLGAPAQRAAKITMDEAMPAQAAVDQMELGNAGIRHGGPPREVPGATRQSHQASLYSHCLEGVAKEGSRLGGRRQ